jgi:ribosomal protein S18 acetylase RimI-like enzyme
MELSLRRAWPGDLPILRQFEQGVLASERPLDPTLKDQIDVYYDWNYLLFSPDACLLVAENPQWGILGSGYGKIRTVAHYFRHTHQAYLGFMYVKPEFRGMGINRQIIDRLRDWASQKQVSEVFLEVYEANLPAIKAYEKSGFCPYVLQMRFLL